MSAAKPATSKNGGFFKSSHSNDGPACVEVKFDGEWVLLRDSKQTSEYVSAPAMQPTIALPAVHWAAFLDAAVQRGPASIADVVAIEPTRDNGITLRAPDNTTLTYTTSEWDAFVSGIEGGEFSLLEAA
ncbi:DUF397 domain-containing protein [Nocardia cyriacigeorgica]|uniref:DUF397 domain-containing protein n=1 Tax=Nocardia cyriacigeorgica (strain GUH-2) TaxID=1127134 RepID=H6R671_NOCCG|nr:DUF397 domain-containing protein [Nocardia cyriacigeorgica]MBF6082421.1 DUF397 domain-containing protein [Nocardia cyriacigeorgica]BDT89656.1 hypothetical protein FMUAM8_54200 [Nocardia cyriacigeorgica]CCF65961.1 conserved protein of unknown function [Nocardia cyriacigeorgica GUH-2]